MSVLAPSDVERLDTESTAGGLGASVAPPAGRAGRRAPSSLLVLGVVIGTVFAGPLAYLLSRNVSGVADLLDTWMSDRALEPLRNTLLLAATVSVGAAVIGTALAWLVTRTDLPARRLIAVLVPLPLVFPSFVGALALQAAFAPGGVVDDVFGLSSGRRIGGFAGAWTVLTLFTYPYVYLPAAARFGSLPRSLEESARLLGRRPFDVFRTIVLPQARSAIAAGTLLAFLYTLSDFGAVQLLRFDTLTRLIYANRLLDQTTSLALSLLLGVLALAVVAAERGVGRRRAATEGVRSRAPLRISLGRWRWAVMAGVVGFLGVALLAPLVSLGLWASRADSQATADLGAPALNTAIVSIVTAAAAVLAVLPLAYLTGRFRSRIGDGANAFVVAGFAIPGLVIALSLSSWLPEAPVLSRLYQTYPVLVFAYVIHFGATASRSSQVAVAAVPRRFEDAARTLGARSLRRFVTIDAPLMRPGLAAGAGLVLLSTMKELPVTLLLAPAGFETLATRIWGAASDNFLAEAGVSSLLLVAVSAVLTWFLVIRHVERFD